MPFVGPAGATQADSIVAAATAAQEQDAGLGPAVAPVQSRELRLAGGLSRLSVQITQTVGTVPSLPVVQVRISNVWRTVATVAVAALNTPVTTSILHVGGATAARVNYPMTINDEVYTQLMFASAS